MKAEISTKFCPTIKIEVLIVGCVVGGEVRYLQQPCFLSEMLLLCPNKEAGYSKSNERVCLPVCLFANISQIPQAQTLSNFLCPLLRPLCTSVFVDHAFP